MLVATLVVCLTGCNKNKYFNIVSSYTFWANKGDEAIAQTHVYNMVKEHMDSETENGKKKKVLVLGFDGTRADALVNIRNSGVKDKDGNDIYSGDNPNNHISAVNHIVDELGGKMYIAYAGGNVKENFQAPSTAPGWASITTGVWGVQNGVLNNPDGEAVWATDFGGICQVPAYIMLTNEIRQKATYGPYGQKLGEFTGGTFVIDYVKVYQNTNYLSLIKSASDFN
ncbi:MAG TPA: hypothetical protein PLZ09_06325 [Clostridia bacterium]|nr:hypothetical protein [Clostridia bacterium]